MAEEKKDKNPKETKEINMEPFEWIVVALFVMGFLSTGLPMIIHYITSGELTFYGYKVSSIIAFFKDNVWFFKMLGYSVAGLSAAYAFVYNKRSDAIWAEEKAKLYPANISIATEDVSIRPVPDQMQSRWQKIVEKSESQNSSDWRLSIIEADIILDELLSNLRLPGDTIGEKLKAVEPSDFITIESAWEAHKARNFIAHEGENFALSQRETRRIISLYEAVFKEFELI